MVTGKCLESIKRHVISRYALEPCARLMFLEQSLPKTCLVVSLRRDLLSPKFSDTIRLHSLVKGKEGVASVYVISDSVVLRTL